MTSLLHDLRFAARSFARAPRFTLPALLALALGIGATSATFSIVRGVMLKPLPYDQPKRIVVVWENNQQPQTGSSGGPAIAPSRNSGSRVRPG